MAIESQTPDGDGRTSRSTPIDAVAAVRDAGVSLWLDALSRDLLETGELARLIAERGITGATSNPTIFAKAIAGSERYDGELADLVRRGVTDARELFFELALADVRRAAAGLAGAYERSGGRDGFVSFECTPDVAHDASATVEQAAMLFRRLGERNVMIKVPATEAGVGAVEELTAAGVNVNVTLLFSLARYDAIVDAYLRGLERRARAGLELGGVASVASFFVSRVDAKADPLLAGRPDLVGRVGIANAELAYHLYRRRFGDRRWERLRARGARSQRPLWASTAPKDPAYGDVVYVECLALPDTIVTVPEPTLHAFADHGRAGAARPDEREAAAVLERARAAGLPLDRITAELEAEGVASFCDSYDELLGCVAAKARRARERAAAR